MACAEAARDTGPQAWLLCAGSQAGHRVDVIRDRHASDRLHLQHGPIDLIIHAEGKFQEVQAAYRQAGSAFASVLETLTSQLALLRRPLLPGSMAAEFRGGVARRMFAAAAPCRHETVTPMIAVAGAVADHILAALLDGRQIERAQVNNGGDIALFLSAGTSYRIGICASPASVRHPDVITLQAGDGLNGVATSGWQGRSHSLGIADAVTVIARTSAEADVAATLIANATNVHAPEKIERIPACSLAADSDLGDRPVTVAVAALSAAEKDQALRAGILAARRLLDRGLIAGAYLTLQDQTAIVGRPADTPPAHLPGIGT